MTGIQLSKSTTVFFPALATFVSYQASVKVAQVIADHFKLFSSSQSHLEYGLTLVFSNLAARKISPFAFEGDETSIQIAFVINVCAITILSLFILFPHVIQWDEQINQQVFAEEWTRQEVVAKFTLQPGFDEHIQRVDHFLKRPKNQSILILADYSSQYHSMLQECALRICRQKLPPQSGLRGRPLFYLQANDFKGRSHQEVRGMVKNLEEKGNAILVIDRLEQIDTENQWIWNHLEPSIMAGKITLIGISTPDNYSTLTMLSPSIQSFNTLQIPPPGAEACFLSLKSQQARSCQYRPGITITDEALALTTLFSYHYVIKGFIIEDGLTILSDVVNHLAADVKVLDGATFLEVWYKLYKVSPLKLSLTSVPEASLQFFNDRHVQVDEHATRILEINKLKKEARSDTRDVPAFMTDMVEMAREGLYAPCIGRNDEIDVVIRSLGQSRQKSLVFTGPPGIGKTAIYEELSRRIALKDPSVTNLQDLLVYEVNVTTLLSTEGYVGQLNKKVDAMINFCMKRRGQVALVIDELHQLRGAGRYKGNENDILEMIKNALARDDIIVLGTTNDYRWAPIVREDPAIERRIKSVKMAPPSADLCRQMLTLTNKQGFYTKDAPLVQLTDEAIAQAVELTGKLKDRYYPDKATILISDVVSFYQLQQERAGGGIIAIGKKEVDTRFRALYPTNT